MNLAFILKKRGQMGSEKFSEVYNFFNCVYIHVLKIVNHCWQLYNNTEVKNA